MWTQEGRVTSRNLGISSAAAAGSVGDERAERRNDMFRRTMEEVEQLRRQNVDLSRKWARDHQTRRAAQDEAKQLRGRLHADVRHFAEEGQAVRHRVEGMNSEVRAAQSECERLELTICELDIQCSEMLDTNVSLSNKIDQCHSDREDLAERIASLVQGMREEGESYRSEIEHLESEFDTVDRENGVLRRYLESSSSSL